MNSPSEKEKISLYGQIEQLQEFSFNVASFAQAARMKAIDIQNNLQDRITACKQALHMAEAVLNKLDSERIPTPMSITNNISKVVTINKTDNDKVA